MRTLLFAALFASGLSFAAPALSAIDPDPAIKAASGKDGGKKKKKDEEKEEDYALAFKRVATATS